jgi:putative transposase
MGRKQKLNACLKKKGQPPVHLTNPKTTAWIRNLIGCALNQLLFWLPSPKSVVIGVENLNVANLHFKSRQGNRLLTASQLGFLRDRLLQKLHHRGYQIETVNAAYSSQQCSACGFVSKANRPTQAEFHCQHCHFQTNADCNASDVIAKRFGDHQLTELSVSRTGDLLLERFLERHQLLLRPITHRSP